MSVGSPPVDTLQLWILTSQVDGMWPLSVVTAPNAGRIMNLRIPTVDRSRLTDALEGLFEAGLLLAERQNQRVPWAGRRELERWIESNDQYPNEIHIGLTASGGSLWERECMADWNRYLNCQGSRAVEVNGEFFFPFEHFEGATLARLTEYSMKYEFPEEDLRLRTRIRELRPWRATYWKTLPSGYRISCQYRREKRDACRLTIWPHRDWTQFTRWYQDPA